MFLNLLIVFGTSHTLSTSSWTVECTLWPAFESGSPFYENKMSFLGNKTYKAAVAHGFSVFTFLCLPLPDSLPGKHWQLMGCSGERPALIDCQQPRSSSSHLVRGHTWWALGILGSVGRHCCFPCLGSLSFHLPLGECFQLSLPQSYAQAMIS